MFYKTVYQLMGRNPNLVRESILSGPRKNYFYASFTLILSNY